MCLQRTVPKLANPLEHMGRRVTSGETDVCANIPLHDLHLSVSLLTDLTFGVNASTSAGVGRVGERVKPARR